MNISKILMFLIVFVSFTSQAGQGCIETTEDGEKHCNQIMSSSSCQVSKNGYKTIAGKKVVKAELATIKKKFRSAKKQCVNRRTGESVDY